MPTAAAIHLFLTEIEMRFRVLWLVVRRKESKREVCGRAHSNCGKLRYWHFLQWKPTLRRNVIGRHFRHVGKVVNMNQTHKIQFLNSCITVIVERKDENCRMKGNLTYRACNKPADLFFLLLRVDCYYFSYAAFLNGTFPRLFFFCYLNLCSINFVWKKKTFLLCVIGIGNRDAVTGTSY